MVIALVFVGVLGAVIGSFLNVVIYRLPRNESLAQPGSHCPRCDAPVAPYDNIPVLSWLFLRGRCRRCAVAISPRYPLVELLTAGMFVALAAIQGVDVDLVQQLPFVAALIALAFIDLDHRILPNKILGPLAVFGVISGAAVATDRLPELLIAGVAAFVALLVVALIQPKGMGMGDVKLAGVLGLFLGLSVIPALLIAVLAGSIVGLAIIGVRGAAARKQAIPFGPFLAFGALVGLLVGPGLIDLYADRFLS